MVEPYNEMLNVDNDIAYRLRRVGKRVPYCHGGNRL